MMLETMVVCETYPLCISLGNVLFICKKKIKVLAWNQNRKLSVFVILIDTNYRKQHLQQQNDKLELL